jgi:Rab GTPase-binding effector protein 1
METFIFQVRWQHEDDVDECNSCKHSLRHKRKHNCRHCGKIFCPDCLVKTVPAGPHGRPARVCDVCHTLLVQHSAPYFSTEAPHMNDR